MNFFKEISELIGADEFAPLPFTLFLAGPSGARVTGVKKICVIAGNEITLAVKGGELSLFGEALKVSSYGEGDISITGKITKTEVRS